MLDFGISKFLSDDSKITSEGCVVGTPLYMSPEQLRASAQIDGRTDIWSMGVILYELVAGQAPWTGSASAIAAAIATEEAPDITKRCVLPPDLAALIHTALHRDPSRRPATVTDFAIALLAFAPEESVGRSLVGQMTRRNSNPRLLPAEHPSASAMRAKVVVPESSPHGRNARVTDLVAFEDAPTHRVAPPSERRSPLVPVALALFALLGVLGVFLALAAKRTPTANATTAIGKESAPPLMPVPSEPLPPAVAAAMAEPPEPAVAPSAIATPPLATAPVPSSAIAARPAAVKPAAKVGSAKPSVPVSTQPRTYGGVPLRIDSPSR